MSKVWNEQQNNEWYQQSIFNMLGVVGTYIRDILYNKKDISKINLNDILNKIKDFDHPPLFKDNITSLMNYYLDLNKSLNLDRYSNMSILPVIKRKQIVWRECLLGYKDIYNKDIDHFFLSFIDYIEIEYAVTLIHK